MPSKTKIMILSYKPFKDFIESKYGEIKSYIRGDCDNPTNTIRLLNVEAQKKYTTHTDATAEELEKTLLHEIVHKCHGVWHNDYNQTIWFAEGLATNLANQDYHNNLEECNFEMLKKDFKNCEGNYGYAYKIVNYVLNNYSEEEIKELYKNPDYLRENSDRIFKEAKKRTKLHKI